MNKTNQTLESQTRLEGIIGITFQNRELLQNALVHRSYHNENKNFRITSNEKLEFLGDSVLSLITSNHLYTQYPKYNEGDYTDIKAAIVNTHSLYRAAQALDLGSYLYLSKGEQENQGRDNMSILADAFEALIGAIYIEHGFENAYEFVRNFLFKDTLDSIINNKLYLPAKNLLQEYYQEQFKRLPEYRVLDETGPEHDKVYQSGVYDGEKLLATGTGKSKKQAEESAAREALHKLGI
jgi:ribonuclease-3